MERRVKFAATCRLARLVAFFVVMMATLSASVADLYADTLDAQVQRLFKEKGFDPQVLRFGAEGFDVTAHDPLIVDAEWELVRQPLSELYAKHFRLTTPPPLGLHFAKTTSKRGELRVRVYLDGVGDDRLQSALARHVACPAASFSTGRIVAEMRTVQLNTIRAKYKKDDGLALDQVLNDFLQMLQSDRGPFKKYNLSAEGRVGSSGLDVRSGWKFYCETGPSTRYFWRVTLRIEKNNWDGWTLHTYVDLGRQLASQNAPRKIGDTHDDHVALNLTTGRGERTQIVRRTVNGGANLEPVEDLSPLGTLCRLLTQECERLLLDT